MAAPETAAAGNVKFGGWNVIKDLSEHHVTEIANFALKKESVGTLKLEKVLHGQSQVVSGFRYVLVLSAKDESGKSNKYLAIVLQEAAKSHLDLIFFAPYLL